MMSQPNLLVIRLLLAALVLIMPSSVVAQSWSADRASSSQGKAYILFQQGMALHKAGDYAGACEKYRNALEFNTKDKNIHHMYGLALSESGNDKAALAQFLTALNYDYNFVECRNNLGILYQKMGEREKAEQAFRLSISINPKFAPPFYHLGQILKEKGDLTGAIDSFESATRIDPDYFDAQRDLGLAIFERSQAGDISQAEEKLQIALKLVPDNPMIHYHLAEIYCAQGRLDDAESEFRRAIMLEPRLAAAHWELAKLRYFRGDLDRCLMECSEAEKINPTYTKSKKYPAIDPLMIKFTTAISKEYKGELALAVEDWKQLSQMTNYDQKSVKHVEELEKRLRHESREKHDALSYNPEEVDALVSKGISQYDDGDLVAAKASFTRALELNGQSFGAMQNLAATLESSGDLEGALTKYQAAALLNPQYAGCLYNIAYVLEKLNLPADAGLMYQKYHEKAGIYPYDPKHIVSLQQEDARQRARQEELRRRGY